MKHDANTKETGTPHHTLCANETTKGAEVCILFGRVWSNPQRLLWCCLFVNSRRPSASYSQKKIPDAGVDDSVDGSEGYDEKTGKKSCREIRCAFYSLACRPRNMIMRTEKKQQSVRKFSL